MTLRRVAPLLGTLVLAVAACAYSAGSVQLGEDLGAVEIIRKGSNDCTELGTEALLQLLEEAKALGGTGVKDVKFRGRYHWMGRVVCRGSLSGSSVQVTGIATR